MTFSPGPALSMEWKCKQKLSEEDACLGFTVLAFAKRHATQAWHDQERVGHFVFVCVVWGSNVAPAI